MIRKARKEDMPRILGIYEIARGFMKSTGNPTQWGDSYPATELLEKHLAGGVLYVDDIDNRVQGVSALITGADATYSYIEDGQWPNDDDYMTMHMVASSGEVKGIFGHFCDYAKAQCPNVRIDTHYDNLVMQHCIVKNGFEYCGRIYVDDGSPRKAYQWIKK